MIDILKEAGYEEFRVPETKMADRLFSRHVESETPDVEFCIHAWYHNPSEYLGESVTFEIRLDDEKENGNIKAEFFGYDSLTPEKLEDIENRILNCYTHMLYV